MSLEKGKCSQCKFLCDVRRDVAPTKGWCPIWEKWQNTYSRGCKYGEAKEISPSNYWKGRPQQSRQSQGNARKH